MSGLFRKAWQYARLALGGLALLVSANMLVKPKSELIEQYDLLESRGVRVAGKVTNLWVNEDNMSTVPLRGLGAAGRVGGAVIAGQRMDRAMDGENPAKRDILTKDHYHVAYAFQPPGKAPIEHRTTVKEAEYNQLAIGGPVDVLFHPTNPVVHRLPAFSKPFVQMTAEMKLQGALFGAVLGGLLLWSAWPRSGGSTPPAPAPVNARQQRIVGTPGSPSPSARPRLPQARRAGFGQRA